MSDPAANTDPLGSSGGGGAPQVSPTNEDLGVRGISWDSALKFLPFIATVAFGIAILFGYGYFLFPGVTWITTLSPQDLIALTWKGLPIFFVGWAMTIFIPRPTKPLILIKTRDQVEEAVKNSGLARRLWLYSYAVLMPLTPLIGILFFILLPAWADPGKLYAWITGPMFLMILCLNHAYYYTFGGGLADRYREAFINIASPLVIMFMISVAQGGGATVDYSSRIVFKDRNAVCVSIVFLGERGAIYSTPRGATIFSRWDQISSVEHLPAACWTGK